MIAVLLAILLNDLLIERKIESDIQGFSTATYSDLAIDTLGMSRIYGGRVKRENIILCHARLNAQNFAARI